MTPFRLPVGVLAALLSFALIGMLPAQGAPAAADPLATTVSGACFGGPGRLALTVTPPAVADGRYQVHVIARGLDDGSRWAVGLVEEATEARKEFRRVAVQGTWTVTTQFRSPGDGDGDEVLFTVFAHERGAKSHACDVLNSPASPIGGLSACNKAAGDGFIILLARELDDGSVRVRSLIFTDLRRKSPWHLTLKATGATSRQVVEFNDRAGGLDVVRSRVVLTGVDDPRLRMVATSQNGASCLIGVNPPNVTTDAPLLLPDGLAKAVASRAGTN